MALHSFSINDYPIDTDSDTSPLLNTYGSGLQDGSEGWKDQNKDENDSCCKKHKRKILIASISFGCLLIFGFSLILILAYTLGPKIIQNTINEASLKVDKITLKKPSLDAVFIDCIGSFNKVSPISATLLSARYTLYYGPDAVGSLPLPDIILKPGSKLSIGQTLHPHSQESHPPQESSSSSQETVFYSQKSSSTSTPVVFNSKMDILNVTAFGEFAHAMIEKPSVKWTLVGHSVITVPLLFNLRVTVTINKEATIIGLNGLKEVSLSGVNFEKSNEKQVKMNALVSIENPSSVSIQPIGNLKLGVYYQDKFMGYASSRNASIVKGRNEIPIEALINPTNLTIASDLISGFLSSRPLNISVRADSNHSSSIPLYSRALEGLEIDTTFVQTPPIQLIPAINVQALSLLPISNTTCAINVTLEATIHSPLGPNCPFTVQEIEVNVSLFFRDFPTGHFSTRCTLLSQTPTSIIVNASALFDINKTIVMANNKTAFENMLTAIEHSVSVNVTFIGSTHVDAHVPPLGNLSLSNLLVNTETSILGLNDLPGTTLVEVDVPGNAPGPPGSGLSLFANGTMFNPSALSMSLGNITMHMFANGTFMGVMTCENFATQPGLNLIQVAGVLKPSNNAAAASFFRRYLVGLNSIVTIKGALPSSPIPDSSEQPESPNLESIDWLNAAILSLDVQAIVPGRLNYDAIRELLVVDLLMDFTTKDGIPKADGTMKAIYTPPFGFPFTFLNATIQMTMAYDEIGIANMEMPWHTLVNMPEEEAFEVSVKNLTVGVTNATQFANFLTTLFLQAHTTASLSGLAGANVDTNLGVVPIREMPFSNVLQLNGTNRFQTPPVLVRDLNLVGGSPGVAFITLQLNITNPSSASLYMGKLVLSLMYKDTYIGNGTIEAMNLYKGENTFQVHGFFFQLTSNEIIGREFLSQFVQGHSLDVSLQGTMWSSNVSLLRDAVSHLNVPATLPGFPKKLITFAQLVWSFRIFQGEIPAQLTVFNPFDADIAITYVNVNVMYKGKIIAFITQNLTTDPIIAKAHVSSLTPVMYGKIEGVSIDFLRTLFGDTKVDVNGTLSVYVGTGFQAALDYIQTDIPASFKPAGSPSSTSSIHNTATANEREILEDDESRIQALENESLTRKEQSSSPT